jgi:spermidine synthase
VTDTAPTLAPEKRASLQQPALLLIFAASGANGLVYEVVWMRALRLIVGSTTLSHTIVIAAFMAGLALGAALAGPRADREPRPLRLYARLELAIGVYALAFLGLAAALGPLLGALYRACEGRPTIFALGELVVLAPIVLPGSALMGATLPVLGRAIAAGEVARAGGRLYAANTLGASAGAALAGFVLLPLLGLLATTGVAAAANVALALFVLSRERGSPDLVPPKEAAADDSPLPGSPRLAALAIALSGLAGMTLQIVWTRLFVVSVGSSTFAFAGVVAVYILGLGGGAALGTWALSSRREPAHLLAAASFAAGALAALTGGFFAWLPAEVASIVSGHESSMGAVLAREVALVAVALALPTTFLGAVFPLGVALAGGSPSRPGQALGRISAASSLGSIAGALVGGLALLPLLGLSGALRAGAVLAASAGAVCLLAGARASGLRVLCGLGALVGVATGAGLVPTPDARLLDSGAFLYGARMIDATHGDDASVTRRDRPLFHAEGADLVAAIYGSGFEEYLVINGKTDASSAADAETQLLLGHIPMLLHGPGAKNVCVVGLGSGMTAGAVLSHPGVEHVDLVEISPTVIEAVESSALFGFLSHDALRDGRLRLLVADGRTHLRNARSTYDVIVSEPTNPWIAGVGDLYTREHFARVRERLAPGGVFGQWIQGYSTTPALFATIVRTFRSVFPGAQLWRFARGEDMLIVARNPGGSGSQAADPSHDEAEPSLALGPVRELIRESETLRRSLADAGVDSAETLPWFFALDAAGVSALAGDGPCNTDDSGYLEHRAPFALFETAHPLEGSAALELEARAHPPFPDVAPDELARVRRALPSYASAVVQWNEGGLARVAEVERSLRSAIAEAPPASPARELLAEVLVQKATHAGLDGAERLATVEEIEGALPRSCAALEALARTERRLKRADAAERIWRRILELRPRSDAARIRYARFLTESFAFDEALSQLNQLSRETAETLTVRADALLFLNRTDLARAALDRARALDPLDARVWLSIGRLRAQSNDLGGARDACEHGVALAPGEADAWFRLAFACAAVGDRARALEACRRSLGLDPHDSRATKLLDQLEHAQ